VFLVLSLRPKSDTFFSSGEHVVLSTDFRRIRVVSHAQNAGGGYRSRIFINGECVEFVDAAPTLSMWYQ
jgi:hypothetical protein